MESYFVRQKLNKNKLKHKALVYESVWIAYVHFPRVIR